MSLACLAETRIQTAAFEELLRTFFLRTQLLHPSSSTLISGKNESGLEKRRQICAVPKGRPESIGKKGKLSISREEPPNSATHLLRHFCHHGDQLAITHPIRACFTQTNVEPGFLRETSVGLSEQDLSCPLSPTHPVVRSNTSFPQTVLWQ